MAIVWHDALISALIYCLCVSWCIDICIDALISLCVCLCVSASVCLCMHWYPHGCIDMCAQMHGYLLWSIMCIHAFVTNWNVTNCFDALCAFMHSYLDMTHWYLPSSRHDTQGHTISRTQSKCHELLWCIMCIHAFISGHEALMHSYLDMTHSCIHIWTWRIHAFIFGHDALMHSYLDMRHSCINIWTWGIDALISEHNALISALILSWCIDICIDASMHPYLPSSTSSVCQDASTSAAARPNQSCMFPYR